MSKMVDADLFLYLFRQIPFVMEHPEIREQFEKWAEGLPEAKEKTGYWHMNKATGAYYCSCCGESAYLTIYCEPLLSEWCPDCGAHMIEEDEEEEDDD